MKRIAYFLTMALVLPLFAACSDDTEEILEPEVVDTRIAPFGWELYYYTGHVKRWYKFNDEKTFIYYHPQDEDVLYQKLADRGIEITSTRPTYPIGSPHTWVRNRGEDYDYIGALVGMEVASDYESILDIPEIVGACPGLILEENNWGECKGTCLFYVLSSNNNVLKKIAEKYKVHIIGSWENKFDLSLCFCDKNSKGNALDICRDIIDSKMFDFDLEVEPALIAARLGGFIGDEEE